jgi:hypothetical protein
MRQELAMKRNKVEEVVQLWLRQKVFTMNGIKRSLQVLVKERKLAEEGDELVGMLKPAGTDVIGMYKAGPNVFASGDEKLPEGSHHLKVENMVKMHVESCLNCTSYGSLDSSCYFFKMIKCIENGWKVPIDESAVRPKYKLKSSSDKNYGSVKVYEANFREEFNKMLGNGVLREVDLSYARVISPMSAIVKNSDICRAKVLVNILVVDEASLLEANRRLVAMGFKKIKVRAALDVSATGINDASPKPPFRYPSLQDGLKLVSRGCWLGKTDVERYFFCFPLAEESYPWFVVYLVSKFFCFIRAMFGYAPCPYYTSTWGAEFLRWVNYRGVPAAFMVDDWLTAGSTEEQAKKNLAIITAVFVLAGFVMAIDKEEVGQRLTFLGVLIDTVKMCITFDEIQARSMMLQMIEHVKLIETGYDLDYTTIRSVAGKLEWYSEVLQSGRIHLRSWWLYVKYRNRLSPVWRHKLVNDSRWWIERLEAWSNKGVSGIEYPIVSVEDLLTSPESICMMASDASGIDGFGYYWGNIDADDFSVYAKKWGGKYEFVSSHTGELQALRHFLEFNFDKDCKVLIWITDCLSAMFTVNKGRCREESGLKVLEDVLQMCDDYKVQLLALWMPRDSNTISDYLSHLCVILNRDEYEGRSLRDLQVSESQRVEGRREEGNERSEKSLSSVSELVYTPGMEFVPKDFYLRKSC